jgi:hypothetical protein
VVRRGSVGSDDVDIDIDVRRRLVSNVDMYVIGKLSTGSAWP